MKYLALFLFCNLLFANNSYAQTVFKQGKALTALTESGGNITASGGVTGGVFLATGSGSSGVNAYGLGNDVTLGLYSPATNVLGFSANGAERMRIGSGANVGIATTTPSSILHVANTGALTITTNTYVQTIDHGGVTTNNTANNLKSGGLLVRNNLQGTAGGNSSTSIGLQVLANGGDTNYLIGMTSMTNISNNCYFQTRALGTCTGAVAGVSTGTTVMLCAVCD